MHVHGEIAGRLTAEERISGRLAAIKKFQKAQGLTQDGKFGSKSKAKAQALIKKYAK